MAKLAHKNLHPASPAAALRAPARPAPGYKGQGRRLSEAQLKLPFFKKALERLESLVQTRFQLLPRMLAATGSERVTRIEVYKNLAAVANPMLARLDLATGVLGWLDEGGNFRLNNQKNLAHDAGLASACLNRLFKRLEGAGYLTRRIERIAVREHGIQLVRTRVLIKFTDLFWRHLQMSFPHSMARKAARKKRLRELHAHELARARTASTPARKSTAREQNKRRADIVPLNDSQMEQQKRRVEILLQLRAENPTLSAEEVKAKADAILSSSAQ